MMQVVDLSRYEAYAKMLKQPDPADLPHRGTVLRYEGDPNRYGTVLPRLVIAWVQHKILEKEP